MMNREQLINEIYSHAESYESQIKDIDNYISELKTKIEKERVGLGQKLREFEAFRNVLDELGVSHDFDEPTLINSGINLN